MKLPRSEIRMRYVRLVHAFHVLDGSCSHNALMHAMQTLLAGYVPVDEGDHSTQYYQVFGVAVQEHAPLCEPCSDTQSASA
jgi:hypothetical protein